MSAIAFTSRAKRLRDLADKAWSYLIHLIAHPTRMPAALLAVSRGAHLGETLKLSDRHDWLSHAQIRTVIDVGAHTGQFSSALRQLLPHARIYAFEPIADCHEKLERRFSEDARFHSFNTALGERDGEIAFHTSSFPKASSPLPMTSLHREAFPWSADTSISTVPVRRLDSYAGELELEPNVMLKVDVQGYEQHVLSGADEILAKTSYVLVELSFAPLYDGQADFHDIYSYLVNRGFSYAGSWDQLESPLDHTIIQADALFVRSS